MLLQERECVYMCLYVYLERENIHVRICLIISVSVTCLCVCVCACVRVYMHAHLYVLPVCWLIVVGADGSLVVMADTNFVSGATHLLARILGGIQAYGERERRRMDLRSTHTNSRMHQIDISSSQNPMPPTDHNCPTNLY